MPGANDNVKASPAYPPGDECAMVPMYAAPVEHLTNHDAVTALCEACAHVAEVPVEDPAAQVPQPQTNCRDPAAGHPLWRAGAR